MRGVLVLLSSMSLCGSAISGTEAPRAYLHPQHLVTVQGARRLNVYCIGQGSPTVLFDFGLSDSTAVWRLVQPSVAKFTRACAYDRAGYGFSDPPSGVSDAKAAVADLHRLITAAPIETPIIYVGHSIAGEYGVLYEATYPRDIAAEVLVDPSFANQDSAQSAVLSPKQRVYWYGWTENAVAKMKKCAVTPNPLPKDCLGSDLQTGPADTELAALEHQRVSRRSYILANASELESFASLQGRKGLDEREVEAMPTTFGDKTLIILTQSKGNADANFTASQNAAIERAWNEGHVRLAKLSSHGSNTVVPESSHYIQIDQPKTVINAVLKAVAEVRHPHVP